MEKMRLRIGTVLVALIAWSSMACPGAGAASTRRPKRPLSVALTAEDRAIEVRLCDPATPVEVKEKVFNCMQDNFPEKVLEAGLICTMEAVPGESDRVVIAEKLCNDKAAKRMLANCMRAKSLFLIRDLDRAAIEAMTINYRVCARDAVNSSENSTSSSMVTNEQETVETTEAATTEATTTTMAASPEMVALAMADVALS